MIQEESSGPQPRMSKGSAAVLALLSAGAGAIHFAVAGGHFEDWFLQGVFFVLAGWFQISWAIVVFARPVPWVLWTGAGINAAIIATWATSRTVGLPFDPRGPITESIEFVDASATTFEALVVLGCGAALAGAMARTLGPRLAGIVLVGAMTLGIGGVTGAAVAQADEHAQMTTADEENFEGRIGDVYAQLQDTLESSGTASALGELLTLSENDTEVLGQAHQLVHALGRYSYEFYGDAGEAFRNCTNDFESGCYHGVLEGHLEANPDISKAEIATLCDDAVDAGSPSVVNFQCIHGLGHGLSLTFEHDLMEALYFCDALRTDWDRDSCYSGAFMENIIFAMAPPEVHEQHAEGEHKTFLKRDDPLYPCNAVATRYVAACYQIQSSAILWFNGGDHADAFDQCDKAPNQMVPVCYASLGRDISGATLRDATSAIELCKLGQPQLWGACFAGVARNMTNQDATTDQAIAFCGGVPERSRATCFLTIGEDTLSLFPTSAERAAECKKVPALYEAACRRGARLTRAV